MVHTVDATNKAKCALGFIFRRVKNGTPEIISVIFGACPIQPNYGVHFSSLYQRRDVGLLKSAEKRITKDIRVKRYIFLMNED